MDGLLQFNPHNKIAVMMADQSKVNTEGSGDLGPLQEVHLHKGFGAPLLSITKLYNDGMATVFHPTKEIFVADANAVHVQITGNPLFTG
jgi:hypothetical protein